MDTSLKGRVSQGRRWRKKQPQRPLVDAVAAVPMSPCVPCHTVHTSPVPSSQMPVALCWQTGLRLLELLPFHAESRRPWEFHPSWWPPLTTDCWVQGCAPLPLCSWQGVTYTVPRAPQQHCITATLCGTLLDSVCLPGLIPS